MKTGIKVEKTSYQVNEKNKTVVCKIWFTLHHDVFEQVKRLSLVNSNIWELINKYSAHTSYKDKEILFSVSGSTTVKRDDEFDVKTGKKISNMKAERKMFKFTQALYSNVPKMLEDEAEKFKKMAEKVGHEKENSTEKIKKF